MSTENETVQQEPTLRTRSVRLKEPIDAEIERLSREENRSYSQQAATLLEEALSARRRREAA